LFDCLWCLTPLSTIYAAGQWFFPGTQVSSTNKTDRHDIVEIYVESDIKHHNPTQPTR